jgi:glycosyltransferase involved in cell wall biosynthesis
VRLLHVTDRASARGGADWHLLGVLESLVARGHEVRLAVGRDDGTASMPCPVATVRGLDDTRGGRDVAAPLDAIASDWAPDLIHIHNAVSPEALEWAAQRGAVATVQDHRGFCPGQGKLTLMGETCRSPMSRELCAACFEDQGYARRIQDTTERRLSALRKMRAITVLSRYMRSELGDVGVTNVSVIPPFVHGLDEGAVASGPPCVLFAGRLVRAKGIDDAVLAWERSKVDLPLVIAGSGRMRGELERRGVDVLGWIDHAGMSAVYRRARAVVLPSRWQEPFGIVGLEALAMGVPVAAWRSGGVQEWHPGGDLLVDWGDVDGLASALAAAVGIEGLPAPGFERAALMDALEDVYRANT